MSSLYDMTSLIFDVGKENRHLPARITNDRDLMNITEVILTSQTKEGHWGRPKCYVHYLEVPYLSRECSISRTLYALEENKTATSSSYVHSNSSPSTATVSLNPTDSRGYTQELLKVCR